MRIVGVGLALFIVLFGGVAQAQFGAEISDPEPLNSTATTDSGEDRNPQIITDGAGNWIAVWQSYDLSGGTLGTDDDIFIARSTDNGASWSPVETLNTNAGTDSGPDYSVQIATDGSGNWVAVWYARITNTSVDDADIYVARSTDNGMTWSPPVPLNTNAGTDSGDDFSPRIATDRLGNWVVVWHSRESSIGEGIGADDDILIARSTNDGVTWSSPEALNATAATDGSSAVDRHCQVKTDRAGNWVAVWWSSNTLGDTVGYDNDIFLARSTDNGMTWTYPEPLNTNAATDGSSDDDFSPQIATDGSGNWVAVWNWNAIRGGPDVSWVARSTDNGASWSSPEHLNTSPGVVSSGDRFPQITTDELGNWVAVWHSYDIFDGEIGQDSDIFFTHSTDNGETWSDAEPLNTNAATDSGYDSFPQIATDRLGNWVAVWASQYTIDDDSDILVARWGMCTPFVDTNSYGRLLFPPLCTQDASGLALDVYDSTVAGINRGNNDRFYMSSDGMSFSSLVVDDAVHINGEGSGLGPYTLQSGIVPPNYALNAPIENNLVPLPAHNITDPPDFDLLPIGSSQVLFELLDTQRAIYGNTAVYLVRDCGIYLGKEPDTTLHWLSHDVEVNSFQSNLDVVSGMISELRSDQDFSQACDIGSFLDMTQAVDVRPDPAVGDGYYYLLSGTCAQPIGYGNSSVGPRQGLPPSVVCP